MSKRITFKNMPPEEVAKAKATLAAMKSFIADAGKDSVVEDKTDCGCVECECSD